MNSRLEQFVRDHRPAFDGEEPDDKIWESVRRDLPAADPGEKKQVSVVRIRRIRWSVAAAILLLIAGTGWYLTARRNNPGPAIATENKVSPSTNPAIHSDTPAQTAVGSAQPDSSPSLAGIKPNNHIGDEPSGSEWDASVNEEMYHYAKLVEIKHKELKSIEKDEPLLYKQFSSDVSKLDSVYRSLQVQLPQNPNREQLLEAMLQNLQLQMGLLNHQLDIIKQINHSKKTAYEKAYKTT